MKQKQTKVAGVALGFFILGCSAFGYGAAQREYFASHVLEAPDHSADELAPYPLTTRDRKVDRIATVSVVPPSDTLQPSDRLAQAHLDPGVTHPAMEPIANPPLPRPRPKTLQKTYTLLSDIQIDAIKARLKLTAQQESGWPAVEVSFRSLAARLHEIRSSGGAVTDLPLDSPELTELQTAATRFIAQLRPNQKRELKMLAHLVGLGTVVAQL